MSLDILVINKDQNTQKVKCNDNQIELIVKHGGAHKDYAELNESHDPEQNANEPNHHICAIVLVTLFAESRIVGDWLENVLCSGLPYDGYHDYL